MLFTTQTCFESLNQVLKRLKRNKDELLLVLERPELPLHNNLSEGDIRVEGRAHALKFDE